MTVLREGAMPSEAVSNVSRFMKSSWLLALSVNGALAGYFIVSGLGFGMWCVFMLVQQAQSAVISCTHAVARLL